jgi:hypothetical protein
VIARVAAAILLLVLPMADASRAGVDGPALVEVVSLYTQAQDRLRAIVLNPAGRTQGSQDYRRMRAAQQVRQVEDVLAGLGTGRRRWADEHAPEAYRRGLATAAAETAELRVNPPASALTAGFSEIATDAVELLARDIATDLANADRSMGATAKFLITKTSQQAIGEAQLNRILAGGIIDGTPVDTIRDLREALKSVVGGRIDVPTRNGGTMNFETAHYARLVAVTKTREAVEKGRHQRFRDEGIRLVKVVGTFSGTFCTAYLGMVFSIDGADRKFPALSSLPRGGPPFHPFCGKSTRAFVPELASARELREAEGLADAAKLIGVSGPEAQRRFKTLQLQQQVRGADGYAAGLTPARTAGVAEQEPARSRRQALSSPAPRPAAAPTPAIPLARVLNKRALADLRRTGGTLGDHQALELLPIGRAIEHVNPEGTYRLRVVAHEAAGTDQFGNPKVLPRFAIEAAPAGGARLNGQPSLYDVARDAGRLTPRRPAAARPARPTAAASPSPAPASPAAAPAAVPPPKLATDHDIDLKPEHLAAVQRVFGRPVTGSDIARAAGAPDGTKVAIRYEPALYGGTERVFVDVTSRDAADAAFSMRRMFRVDEGKLKVANQYFRLGDAMKAKTSGTEIFAAQVEGLRKLGVDRIETMAARQDGKGGYNGYYTWARLGYDAPFRTKVASAPPAVLAARTLHEVMSTAEGREWWKLKGRSFQGTFKITPTGDSPSERMLHAYRQERANRPG